MAAASKALVEAADDGEVVLEALPLIVAESVYTLESFYELDRQEVVSMLTLLLQSRCMRTEGRDGRMKHSSTFKRSWSGGLAGRCGQGSSDQSAPRSFVGAGPNAEFELIVGFYRSPHGGLDDGAELIAREVREFLDGARGPFDADGHGAEGVAQAEVRAQIVLMPIAAADLAHLPIGLPWIRAALDGNRPIQGLPQSVESLP